MTQLSDLEATAASAIAAGVRVLSFDGSRPSIKRDGSLLTVYDTLVETEVVTTLSRLDPGSSVISEESSTEDLYEPPPGFHGWVLDPIDGTTNFAAGFPVFSVSLAYYEDGQATFGVIWDSLTRQAYSSPTISSRSYVDQLDASYAACDFEGDALAHAWGIDVFGLLANLNRSTRVIGSVALGMLWTSLGRFDLYCAPAPKLWDYGAGDALIRAAGGSVVRRELGTGRPSLVCGSPALVHELVASLEARNEHV